MKTKTLFGLLSVLAVCILLVGPAIATSYTSVTADKDIYRRNETVVITYEGLGGSNYQYNVRIAVLNEEQNIFATSEPLPEVSGNINYTWEWNQIGNYGEYAGQRAIPGTYYITLGYFYTNGTVMWLFPSTYPYLDNFTIGGSGGPGNGPGGPGRP